MRLIQACALPAHALLARYDGAAFSDCYRTEVASPVTQAQFVEAFYTGSVFKLERLLLAWFASRPSTDAQARALALGKADQFAAWRVEARTADQLLLCDFSGRTRSWLMTEPLPGDAAASAPSTRLYFGSAVMPVHDKTSGRPRLGLVFKSLLGFHQLYSRVLLDAARARLARP